MCDRCLFVVGLGMCVSCIAQMSVVVAMVLRSGNL